VKRRVIFPDPSIWTNKKEPTMNFTRDDAGDLRRAAAFIKHHHTRNLDGMNAILIEAIEAKRTTEFIAAILDTFDAIVPQLVTPAGQRGMAELVLAMADGTHHITITEEWNRAARFLIAYGDGDNKLMTRIMHETDDVSPTIVSILDVYTVVLPMLHTPFGIDTIDRGINTLAGIEAGAD
jgi:hypothetical protein